MVHIPVLSDILSEEILKGPVEKVRREAESLFDKIRNKARGQSSTSDRSD